MELTRQSGRSPCIKNNSERQPGNIFERWLFNLKEITKNEMNTLMDKGILRNSRNGFVDKRGYTVGFYKTRNKRYIEDKFADLARKMS